MTLCQICEKRRPRRYCPGIRGEICPRCCGEEREITVDCPLDCEYLLEARRHERENATEPIDLPHRDIEITHEFLSKNEPLLIEASRLILEAVHDSPGAVDTDVREALAAMTRTFRTRESGLIYESRPNNQYAAGIQRRVSEGIEEFRRLWAERTGASRFRDKDVLGVLAFLQQVEALRNNGRRRGRAFLSFLQTEFRVPAEDPGASAGLLAP